MANHGYITGKKNITKEMVDKALANINEKFLFGKLCVQYSHHPGDHTCWGEHIWYVTYDGNGFYDSRVFWLPHGTSKKFEIRHGGGGDFIWWVELLILNAVATACNGTITDDGHNVKSKAENEPSESFKRHKFRHYLKRKLKLSAIRQQYKYWKNGTIPVPPEHIK